ncbi:MAG: ABC transporter permease [Clostridiales bacterium]|nr:ABC transporter permease [Clostridiales bacterium]
MTSIVKLTCRSIRSFFGRYMALLLIVMLSVGFFAGLKVTQDAMANTCEDYFADQNFYDYRLLSTLGFTEEDVEKLAQLSFVSSAEGMKSLDAVMEQEGSSMSLHLLSLPESVSLPSLAAGRMPEAENECLADAGTFEEEDIGSVLSLVGDGGDQLSCTEYTIVGLVHSPAYLGLDRGTTNIGNGSLDGFLYLPASVFVSEPYTQIQLTLSETAPIYSEEYEELIESHEEEITELCQTLAESRYNDLLAQTGLPVELAEQAGIAEPEVYVLTREENAGYVSFENDTSILSGIANIFPVFFVLIAMLVCITTMTRMVDEERTQIGVLKALGYGNGAISAKYLLYAGSATLLGWLIGFFLGTWGLPQVFWYAYRALYDFAPLSYLFSPSLALLTLAVSLVGILGSTWLSCRKELGSRPALLLRPRAAKTGKRIFLERITPLWKHLRFLQKVTLRNMFRYKQRLVMMLVGISCCAGLVLTGFGVRDSMVDTGSLQYDTVQKYDIEASFDEGNEEAVQEALAEIDGIDGVLLCSLHRMDVRTDSTSLTGSLYSFASVQSLEAFWDLHAGEKAVPFPEEGEVVVGQKVAEKLSLSVGDTVEIQDTDLRTLTVTVSGIFDNYVDNVVLMSADTYQSAFADWQANTALLNVNGDTEALAETLTGLETFTGVTQLSTTRENVDSALSCLDYIICLIVLFSGALAFIVIFNLTNINLAERSREIATVEVLGFYPRETESYVLRENLVLSVLASIIGLPLGVLFHRIVMHMIVIDAMFFPTQINPLSFVLAFVCTVVFAAAVSLFMKRRIGKINMAESLKAVE